MVPSAFVSSVNIPFSLHFSINEGRSGTENTPGIYGLGEAIKIINEDVKNLKNIFSGDTFDIITVNPPYFKVDGCRKNICESCRYW